MNRSNRPTVILVFHINKDHSEVSWRTYREMIENGEFLEMFNSISVPVELSVQAEDIEFLNMVEPTIVEEINANSNIGVLRGAHTHTMFSFFPGVLAAQLNRSNSILSRHFGDKLSWVGGLPEVDINTSLVPVLQKNGWGGALVLEDLHYTYNWRPDTDTRIPLDGESILRSGDLPLIMATGTELRNFYLKLFRGFATAEELLDAFESRAKQSNANLVVFYTDFEVPQINAVDGKSRLGLWEEFFDKAASSSVSFAHFNDLKEPIQKAAQEAKDTQIEVRPMSKWHRNTELYEKIQKALKESAVDERILFRLTVSDTFSSFTVKPMDLPVKGGGEVHIRANNEERMAAFNHFLARARGEDPKYPSDENLRWYLKNVDSLCGCA